MTRTPAALAALASVAVRGLNPTMVQAPTDYTRGDYDVAFVDDDRGMRWVVRAPRRTSAALSLEAEALVLSELRQRLPVAVPHPAGYIALPEGGRAVIYPFLPGAVLRVEQVRAGSSIAVQIGRIIAALHEIPVGLFDQAGVPTYTAEEYRRRRLAEVDSAAQAGRVPPILLTRWEKALEDVGQWRFQPTPIHGDLAADHVLVDDDVRGPQHARVSGLVDWAASCVADPADDLAWVALAPDPGAFDTVLESYAMARHEQPDRHLAVRARLVGELALVRWLLAGVAADDREVIAAASSALDNLADRVAVDGPHLG